MLPPTVAVNAPTTIVFPLIATADPKLPAPSEEVSLATCVQTFPEPTNTYAPPPEFPTTTVLPLMAEDKPKRSFCAPSEAVSLALSTNGSMTNG